MVLGLLPELGFLVSPLATAPALASKIRIVCPRVSFRFTVVFLALITLSLHAFHLPKNPSALTCRGRVPPKVITGSLCQRPLSHVSTQGLVRLTICRGNHFQEITVGCWRVLHHSRYLDRLLEVRTCGSSVTVQRLSLRRQACHQGRVPRCTSSLICSAGQGYLSRALLCDFHLCPRALP